MTRILSVAALLLLTGCAAIPSARITSDPCCITPTEAVLQAAASAPRGVQGVFAMRVTAFGRQNDILYLNSEADYRDQRNLTVVIPPNVQRDFSDYFGTDYVTKLKGQTVRVTGEAKRVRIDFTAGGQPTGKYYYQTHVQLDDAKKLQLVP
jgi:hypothetical protein